MDILKKVVSFFETENHLLNNLCGCFSDRPRFIMGTRIGFQVHIKCRYPSIKYTNCMIHRIKTFTIFFCNSFRFNYKNCEFH